MLIYAWKNLNRYTNPDSLPHNKRKHYKIKQDAQHIADDWILNASAVLQITARTKLHGEPHLMTGFFFSSSINHPMSM